MAYDFNSLTKQADEAINRDGFYTDFEDVDTSKLHQISELTEWMRTKAKGSDVREVIAQLFERTWVESIKEGNANMEVAQARGSYPNLKSRLDNVDSKQRQNTAQLAQKANKDEVTNVMTPKGNIAYASLPTSGNQVGWYYYCPDGDGTHGAGNYVWNGTSWYFGGTGDEGYNLLKKDIRTLLLTDTNITQDRYVDIRWGIVYNNDHLGLNATDYIEISEFDTSIFFYGLYYNKDDNAGLAFYDSSKRFIKNSGIKLYQLPNKITIPSNARFIRVTVPQTNTTFALSFASDNAKVNAFIDETRNKVVTEDECTFIEKSKNLFDKNTITLGYYVDPDTGNLLENANFWVSDFIKVEPNQAYTIRYKNQGAQYDANKQAIGEFTVGYSDNTSALPATGTTKPNAKYVRFCGSLAQLSSDQLEKGDVFTSYEEFSMKIDSSLIPETHKTKTLEDVIYKIFSGTNTKIKLVGDSITHGVGGTGFEQNGEYIASFFGNKYHRNPNGYCWAKLFKDYLESKFSCTVTNNAVMGTSFNELNNAFTTLVSDSDDIVICMYGTNNRDSLSSMPAWIQSVINKFNDLGVDLIIMTPIPASVTDETKHTNHIEDVCNTVKKLCIKNNVVFVDTNQIMLDYCEYRGISIDTLLADGLHPNDIGHLVMFNAICKLFGITRKVTGATW